MIEGLLVPSTNSGRYAIGDSDHGPDLSGGTHIEIYIAGQWVHGLIEHAGHDGPGRYSISGQSGKGQGPQSEEDFQQAVRKAMMSGKTLEQALSGAENRITGVFRGYYAILDDNSILGLCTGMRVRLVS